jgi:high affinity Mn2+ porin
MEQRRPAANHMHCDSRAAKRVGIACTVALLAFAGCENLTGTPRPTAWPPGVTSPAGKAPQSSENGNGQAAKRPASRTLPEALCAYLNCLRYGTPPQENPSNGEDKENKNGKDNSGEKGEKSSQPNGGKDDKKEEPGTKKESEQGKKDGENGMEKDQDKEKKEPEWAWYSAHGQTTIVTQTHDVFPALYTGTNSLRPVEGSPTSLTSTLFLAARLWESGELLINPEIAGGLGFSNTTGVAGFPNGEITRVGLPEPTPYFARFALRQTFGLGGTQELVEDGPNQIAGLRDIDRVTVTLGKLTATDIADDNRYSHDPRTQFLNWSLIYNGAWDYPANVRGYTYGLAVELNRRDWAVRYGIFAEPAFANGAPLDPHFLNANGQVVEVEERYCLGEHPGKLRLLAFLNHAHMGNYNQALAEMPVNPDVTLTRVYRFKYGFGVNFEQEATKDLGLFGRLGWDDGHSEAWAFTEIDRTASLGLVLKGTAWCRPDDEVGLAGVINGLAGPHRHYLGAGGLGFIIGDGQLRYGPEEILELYYNFQIHKGIDLTLDFQEINHPAYNRDRGPVSVGSIRVHFEF